MRAWAFAPRDTFPPVWLAALGLDVILVASGGLGSRAPEPLVARLEDVYNELSALPNAEFVMVDGQRFRRLLGRRFKRAFDVAAVVAAAPVAVPLTLGAAMAVRLDSSGPALFRQKRVGQWGREFTCYKLRTMTTGTPDRATHEASAGSVTRVGAVLRRIKIDELPQLWNVLRGDMSLVGPRPCLCVQDELIRLRRELGVLNVPPGITGLAQVQDIDMSDPPRLARADAEYVRTWTPRLDLVLLIKTAMGRGIGDRVRLPTDAGP